MSQHARRVRKDIGRWEAAGLIDRRTAGRLLDDVALNAGRGVNFGAVLAMMAAALFGAAILIFVAANWDAIPRLARVVMLFALIAAAYVGGAGLKVSGRPAAGEALYIIGAAAFGGSIALIGQMYHMSGDERQAILVWSLGTSFAAALLRSPALSAGAVILLAAWLVMGDGFWTPRGWQDGLFFILLGLGNWLVSLWTRSLPARHMLLLSISLLVVVYVLDAPRVTSAVNWLAVFLMVLSAALMAFWRLRPALAVRVFDMPEGLPSHALVGFLTGVGSLQLMWGDDSVFLPLSIVAVAGIVAALLVAGRESVMMRRLAYAAFAFQICLIYVVMIGSMLDTAGFFLFAGLAVAGLAILISRFERRFTPPSEGEAAS